MSDRKALSGLIAAVFAAAVGLTVGAALAWDSEDITLLLSLGVLVVASEVFDFAPLKNSRVSISVVFIFTGAVFCGLPGGVVLAIASALGNAVAHRRSLHKLAFNIGALVLSAAVFSVVLGAFAFTHDKGDYIAQVGPAMVAAALAYGVNSGLVTAAIALDQRLNPVGLWNENFRWLLPHYVFVGILAILISLSYERWEMAGLLLFLFPLAMVWMLMKDRSDAVQAPASAA